MVGENGPPLDGWVCYPRPSPFDAPTVYETAEDDEPHLIRGTE